MDSNYKTLPAPATITQQIANLKELELVIEDETFAASILSDVSYYRLIKAYSIGLKDKNGPFHPGVTLEQIVELYLFNANFRQLLFSQIEKIEVNFRCRVSNYFSITYGSLGYWDVNNFDNAQHYSKFRSILKSDIKSNSQSPFIKNFMVNYGKKKIPFYAVVEVLSFGTLSKFYKNMKSQDKTAIAKMYGLKYSYLESWIESISYVRNVCAHYGRLYNVSLTISPTLYKTYTSRGISNHRIFGVLCCMKHLIINDEHWLEFVDSIEALFDKYPHVDTSLMGFPSDWKVILTDPIS